jgi:transposase
MNDFYLGTDVSKGYADFILIDQDKQTVINSFQLDDNPVGHEQLSNILVEFSTQHPGCNVYSGVESTGGYENNWYKGLSLLENRINIHVARINPIGTSHNSKASMDRIITDKQAARNIAEYLINHKKKIVYKKHDRLFSLRKQWSFVKMLIKQRTQLYNQLQSVLSSANPEVLVYCKQGYPNWLIKLLAKYPTAKQLSEATVAALSSIQYITEQRASKLIASAKISVASEADQLTSNLIRSIIKQIINLTIQIQKQSKLIADNCQLPEVELLKSFKGIGDQSAVGLVLEIVSIDKFSKARYLASYFGLHPVYKMSGDGVWGYHMSKQGRKEPRRLLYMVAKSAIVHNSLIKDIYILKESKEV